MAQIKVDMKARRIVSETEKSFLSSNGETVPLPQTKEEPAHEPRPVQPLPSPRRRKRGDKENDPVSSAAMDSKATRRMAFSAMDKAGRDESRSAAGKQRAFDPADREVASSFAEAFDAQDAAVADRVRSPNPTFLAPTSYAPAANEDLNRYVSSSTTATNATTATTLTNGSAASFVKHPGPPQMMRIMPGDVPALGERVGRMVFDRDLQRWVKDKTIVEYHNGTHNRNRPSRSSSGDPDGESEDPFRDIDSLHDGDSAPLGGEDERQATLDASVADAEEGSADMVLAMDDTDSDTDFDDAPDSQWSTFSFDGLGTGVVHVMTGEDEDARRGGVDDDTSDSDEDIPIADGDLASDDDLSREMASMSLHTLSPVHNSFTETNVIVSTSPARGNTVNIIAVGIHTTMTTPRPSDRRIVQPPKSALKSASVTPIVRRTPAPGHRRSVSFTDGRRDGKILEHEGRRRDQAAWPSEGQSIQPSVRTKRIEDLLENLEDPSAYTFSPWKLLTIQTERALGFENDSPSKGSQGSGRRPVGQSHSMRPLSHRHTRAAENPGTADIARREFARSQSFHARQDDSPRRGQTVTPSRANATFLTECSFGVAHDRLVQVITDVQPFEPYWEALSSVDLSGRRIDSVARLKEFLPRLDSLFL